MLWLIDLFVAAVLGAVIVACVMVLAVGVKDLLKGEWK